MFKTDAIRSWYTRNRLDIWIVIGLFTLAAIPRLTDLGTFLTADEKNWIGRSYEFIRAFKDLRFNDMLQTTHPGVTTLWLSGATITAKIVLSHVPFSFRNLIHFITAAQFPIALVNALAIPVVYVMLRHLFSKRYIPAIAAVFIALNPFLVGYSRVIHVDALLASFLLLACLAIIIYVNKGFSRKWLIISAVLSALALLTKAPAVFVAPFLLLAILLGNLRVVKDRQLLRARARDVLEWCLIIGVLFIVLWPAIIWVPNPEGNALLLKRDIGQAAITPHHMAEDYTLNAWHYPAALVTRVHPIAQVFTGIFIIWLLYQYVAVVKKQRSMSSYLLASTLFISYVVFFLIMMTLGAKKGDRYIMPVFPMIDILAAMGLFVAVGWLRHVVRMKAAKEKIYGAAGAMCAVVMIVTLFIYHPYAIAYSNPFFPDNLSQELGWGEGLERVAAWLNEHAPDAAVASWYPDELGAFTSARVAHINAHEQGQIRYVVLYKNMFGRAADHPANDFIDEYFKKRIPVHIVELVGKEYAWVYEKRSHEKVVGELSAGKVVGQEIPVVHGSFAGVQLLLATYNDVADTGELIVTLKASRTGQELHTWRVPVKDLDDNRWRDFRLPKEVQINSGTVFVEVYGLGTRKGNAPTLRYTDVNDYRDTNMYIGDNGRISDENAKEGSLGIRATYTISDTQVATEEDTKLLLQLR